jgi:serine/threonine-protein kinase
MLDKIGEYRIVEETGRGAMAVVYKAIQPSLNRTVAIKVLSPELITKDKLFVDRFNRESTIIARFNHPNIVHVIDKGSINGTVYFVMDYIEGKDFRVILSNGNTSFGKKMNIFVQVCKALNYAHKSGVIHRDIKPSNILVDSDDNAWLSDFGIAKSNNTEDQDITAIDSVMGTLNYMSPEQKSNTKEVDQRSDIYALGIILYEIATGRKPEGMLVEPRKVNPGISPQLEKVILKSVEQDKKRRYQSVDELKDSLLAGLQGIHIDSQSRDKIYRGMVSLQDKFQLLDIIKNDEFSSVYLFNHKEKQQMMIIKAFSRDRKRVRIAHNLQELDHPHIVRVIGVGESVKQFIIVMNYIAGGNLQDRMTNKYHWKEIVAMSKKVATGLSYAHKKDIIHGNLRPTNILFTKKNVPMITDFALMSHYTEDTSKENWYAPPEPVISPQADIYALGIIIYQLITHKIPENDKKTGQLILDGMKGNAPLVVQKILVKMLEKSRRLRYQTMDEVISDIKNAEKELAMIARKKAESKMWGRKRLVVLGSAGLVVFIICTIYFLLMKYPDLLKGFIPYLQNFLQKISVK